MTKILMTVLAIGVSLAELIMAISVEFDTETPEVEYITTVVFTITYLVSLILLLLSIKFGIQTSPTQFTFYLVAVVCGSPMLRYSLY